MSRGARCHRKPPPNVNAITAHRSSPPPQPREVLGFSPQPNEDTGTQVPSVLWVSHLIGPQVPFLGGPGPGQYRRPERVEDKLCRNLRGGPSTDLCAFLLTYSTGQNSVTQPLLAAGTAGRWHPAVSAAGKGVRFRAHLSFMP